MTKAFEQALDGRHFKCSDTIASNLESYKRMAKRASDGGLQLVAMRGPAYHGECSSYPG